MSTSPVPLPHWDPPPEPIGQAIAIRSIPIQLMPQQIDGDLGDDWTGISNPKTRKKLQDRIHQRKLRRRRKEKTKLTCQPPEETCHTLGLLGLNGTFYIESSIQHQTIPRSPASHVMQLTPYNEPLTLESFTACEPDHERTERFMLYFIARVQQRLSCSPRADMLLSLIQFNSTRALVVNARALGITREFMAPDSRSPFIAPNNGGLTSDTSMPSSLRPTQFQLTVAHHPWIDILPWSKVRDNLLLHDESSYDKKELCRDLRGFQKVAGSNYGGIIAWGEPWDPRGWEVTEAFASKWPWLIQDCYELLESTNSWRTMRGECKWTQKDLGREPTMCEVTE
ncbi:hypothetical protein BKA67DRAFT_562236 [Truncatella angustata]|uniref:Uncharacterized protein n=1 Tax=Truncatella angustata TaxID=152316 RepID=A0A9P9A0F0_9PEZI|nr:uncharacterized protein BKA67DRAFT_562236 [Truncatella angustata]KAH6655944.1 hypothetical protein BKA67DRAFT_562236 [Truncatella angustata]